MAVLTSTLRAVKNAVGFSVFLVFFFLMLVITRGREGEAWGKDDFEE